MKTATWLTVLAVGAILAFAVRTSPPGLNINVVGWIIMLTGAAGFLLPRRASGWVRRPVLMRTGSAVPVSGQPGDTRHPLDDGSYPPDDLSYPPDDLSYPPDDLSYPPDDASYPPGDLSYPLDDASYPPGDASYPQYVLRDPAALASAILRDAELAGTPDDSPQTAAGLTASRPDGGWADPEAVPFDELLQGRTGRDSHSQ
jgi:hypothetical protein